MSSPTGWHDITQIWLKLSILTHEIGATFTINIGTGLFLVLTSALLACFGQVIRVVQGYKLNVVSLNSFVFQCCDIYSIFVICSFADNACKRVSCVISFYV